MANVDNTKLIQFFTGTALPANPVDNYVYFIYNEGKGELYKGSKLIGETNDTVAIANINQAIENINADLAKKATKDELRQHLELYSALLETVTGQGTRLTAAEAQVATNKADIATNLGKINGLDSRIGEAETAIDTIEADYLKEADKTELEGKITAAHNAANTAQSEVDVLEQTHATDKKNLEDAIALKADQTALNAVSEVANAAVKQADYDVKVKALEDEDVRIVGLVSAEATLAREEEGKLAASIKAIADDYLKEADKTALTEAIAEAKAEAIAAVLGENVDADFDTLKEVADWILSDTTGAAALQTDVAALKGDMAAAKEDIGELDEAVSNINDVLDSKADAETVNGQISALEQADEGILSRLDSVEKQLGDGEGSVADLIAAAVAAEKEEREAAVKGAKDAAKAADDKAVAANNAAAEADRKAVAAQGEVDALEEVVATKAAQADLTALTNRVTTAEGEIDTLQSEMDAVEALAAANEEAHELNASNIATNAADIQTLYNALQWHQVV